MTTILEIPEVRQRVSPLSVAEYHRLSEYNERGRRTELIRGIIIQKMAKSPLHSYIAKRLHDLIAASLPKALIVRREDPLTLADSEPEPDIAIIRRAESDYAAAHPGTAELVIEVAVSSPELDRENAALFAEAGVKEYWIALGRERTVEVFSRLQRGRYLDKHVCTADETLRSKSVPSVRLTVASLFP